MNQIENRCLYISGCPGVGKTSTVMDIIKKVQTQLNSKKIKFRYINALELKRPQNILLQFILLSKGNTKNNKRHLNLIGLQFEEYLKTCRTHYFFIIDQVDFLYTKDQNILYNIMEWCSQPSYKFSVILIANTIDFPQRLSPKITSRMGNNRMCFKPYSSTQVAKIVQEKLIGSKYFDSKVINFAAKKFSVYTSDLRKIFRIFQTAINNCKNESKVTIQQLNKIWQSTIQQQQVQWKEQLPEIYNHVIDLIKKQGGKTHSIVLARYLAQRKIQLPEINILLYDLKQMRVIRLNQKKYEGINGHLVTLIEI